MAEVVGTSRGYLSDLETGKRTGGVAMLRAIAQALQITDSELFTPETDDERAALEHMAVYQRLSEADREAVARIARSLLSAQDD